MHQEQARALGTRAFELLRRLRPQTSALADAYGKNMRWRVADYLPARVCALGAPPQARKDKMRRNAMVCGRFHWHKIGLQSRFCLRPAALVLAEHLAVALGVCLVMIRICVAPPREGTQGNIGSYSRPPPSPSSTPAFQSRPAWSSDSATARLRRRSANICSSSC